MTKARKALPHIFDHARSPMEVLLSMLISLPISYGGFAVTGYELNGAVDLSREGKEILGWDSCHCDMLWKEKKVAVEYDSDLVHLDRMQHAIDKKRATALNASGYKVFAITTTDMHSLENLENILFALRRELKMKKETKQFQHFRAKRCELYAWVRRQMQQETAEEIFQ